MGKNSGRSSSPVRMSWERLLSKERLQPLDPADQPNDARSSFVVDQDIIVNSQPFRRLQDKTQVHPLSDNDHVRRRLTHSLEVASIGRALGLASAKLLLDRNPKLEQEGVSPVTFGEILYAACLAHDIGNPPFGHFGEDAIRTALQKVIESQLVDPLSEQQKADLLEWEGNAHGFRVLNTLEKYPGDGGMRLTTATLATFTKYPWSSLDKRRQTKRKFGYFQPETVAFAQVARVVGLIEDSSGGWCRHPLAHLVEAADDIAYALGDLEDGRELQLLTFNEIRDLLVSVRPCSEVDDTLRSERRRIEFLREDFVRFAVQDVAATFVSQHDALLMGQLKNGLLPVSKVGKLIDACKELAKKKIFRAPQKAGIEVASFDVIGALIEKTVTALVKLKREGKSAREHRRMIDFTIGRPTEELVARSDFELLLLTADYIAGMTDSYATRTFRHIKGIEFSTGH